MESFVRIVTLDNIVQAQVVDSALTEAGIPHVMVSYYDAAYDGLFQAMRGWGHVEAPKRFREEVLAVVEAARCDPPPPPADPDGESGT